MVNPEEMDTPNQNENGPHIPISFKRDGVVVVVSSFMDETMSDPDVIVECDCGSVSFVQEGGDEEVAQLMCPACQEREQERE